MSHSLLALRHQIRYSFSVDACGDWTSGAGLCRRLVNSRCSARIASHCFPRPRFELGLLSPVPEVSAKRVRQQVAGSPIIRHDEFDVGLSTPFFSLQMTIMLGDSDGSARQSASKPQAQPMQPVVPNSLGARQMLHRSTNSQSLERWTGCEKWPNLLNVSTLTRPVDCGRTVCVRHRGACQPPLKTLSSRMTEISSALAFSTNVLLSNLPLVSSM